MMITAASASAAGKKSLNHLYWMLAVLANQESS